MTANQFIEIPESWASIELGVVIDYGKTTKVEPEAISPETWVLELEDIEKDSSRLIRRLTFSDRKSKSTKNVFKTGDVLYGKLRPYLNKVLLADSAGVCTTEIVPLQSNAAVHGRYLFHWMRHPTFIAYVNQVSHGVNMPRLGTDAGKKAPFILAPVLEQKRIADKLDTVLARVDACRERLDHVPTLLKRFRQSVLTAALAGKFTGAASYPRVDFGSLIASIRGGTTAVPQAQETEYPVLRSSSVRQGIIDLADVKYLTSDQSQREENFIREGDVLFTRLNGSAEYVGNCAVVPDVANTKYQYPDRLYCARLKETILPAYCMYAFALPEIRAEIERRAKSSAGHKRISIQDIREIEIPLPALAEQVEIVKRIESLFALASQIEGRLNNALATVERITPALLAKAFRGELVPRDPSDEPAAELLKRLTMQRADGGKAGKGSRAKRVAPVSQSDEEEPTTVG